MKWFNFTWFGSAERKRLEEENDLLRKSVENYKRLTEADKKVVRAVEEKPYKNVFFNAGIITVVFTDGTVLSKSDVNKDFLQKVLACLKSEDILELFTEKLPEPKTPPTLAPTPAEKKIIEATSHILETTGDFDNVGGVIKLKGVDLEIPAVVLASFIELTEKGAKEEYEALKMFWLWASLNPIESSREDLLQFIKRNDVTITKNGLLELYRRVEKVNDIVDTSLTLFVSEQYVKVKKWKKNPANFSVDSVVDGLKLLKDDSGSVGNLAALYKNLSNLAENLYTDHHTHKKVIKLGAIYREDEDKIDLNNNNDCSNGLHVGSKSFGFSGFGDVGVMALVNPMKVRSVPTSATNKMRVSEMFIAGVLEEEEYKKEGSDGVNDFSQDYFNSSVDELLAVIKGKTLAPLSCQSNVPALSLSSAKDVAAALKSRITKI